MMARPSYCSWRRSCERGRREGRKKKRRREGEGGKEGEVEQRDKESINIQSKTGSVETHLRYICKVTMG